MRKYPRFLVNQGSKATPTEENRAGHVVASPRTSILSNEAFLTEDGYRVQYKLSSGAPKMAKDSIVKWPKSPLKLYGNESYHPVNDLETLMYLFCISPEFENNNTSEGGKKNVNARFQFIMPEVEAKVDFEAVRRENEAYNHFMGETTQISYAELRDVAGIMRVALTGIEDRDRLNMFNHCKKSENWNQYKRLYDAGEVRKSGKRENDLSDIASKVKSALKSGHLTEKNNAWYITTSGGDEIMKVCATEGHTKKDKETNLSFYFKTDVEALEKLSSVLAEAVA
jgi:hypothetical protein